MDEKPFLMLDLLNIDEHIVPEVKKLTKQSFDIDSIVDAAGELKYLNQIKNVLDAQFDDPEEDFVKFFASRVYSGVLTPKVKIQFHEITGKALKRFMSDAINDRLKSAIGPDYKSKSIENSAEHMQEEKVDESGEDSKIETTQEELDGYQVVRAILRQRVDVTRIAARDTQSYFGVLLDDNNRKPICRLHFNSRQKYIGIFNEEKKESRHEIASVDEIFKFSDDLVRTIEFYEPKDEQAPTGDTSVKVVA